MATTQVKIAERLLKLKLNNDFQKVSVNGGKAYYWTCSTLSRSGKTVDIVDIDDSVQTIKVSDITHIILYEYGHYITYEVARN